MTGSREDIRDGPNPKRGRWGEDRNGRKRSSEEHNEENGEREGGQNTAWEELRGRTEKTTIESQPK